MQEQRHGLWEPAHQMKFCRHEHRWVALVEVLKETSETEGNSVPDPAVCNGNVVVTQ